MYLGETSHATLEGQLKIWLKNKADTDTFPVRKNPKLHNICKSFEVLKKEFTSRVTIIEKLLSSGTRILGEAETKTVCCARGFW